MKKTLALVLALAMVFSTITVAFAEDTLSADAQVCENLGMLVGEGNGVDASYLAKTPTRMQAAIMLLRLKGLYDEAIAFSGTDNFTDGSMAWEGGKNLLAYLKAHPEVGFNGNPDGSFNPEGAMTAQAYYKVMLVALGYTESLTNVVGDFMWENVIEFAAGLGLAKVAAVQSFTVNDLATATVEALKANVKGGETTLVTSLIEAGKIDKAKAVADGLVVEEVTTTDAELDSVLAIANNKVEVVFTADVAKAFAENAANYKVVVRGSSTALEVTAAVAESATVVVLETAAQTGGAAYTLTVGDVTKNFAGIAKISGAPGVDDVECVDTNTVEVTFDKVMDKATVTDIANYTLTNNATVKAAVLGEDRDVVTLTTEGVVNNKSYKLTVANVKSADLVAIKTTTESFTGEADTDAPDIDEIDADDNNVRIILRYDDDHGVDKASAETIANYVITDGTNEVEIESIEAKDTDTGDDDDDYYDYVEITTAPMEKGTSYTLKVNNIVDGSVSANTMAKEQTEKFRAKAADDDAPELDDAYFINDNVLWVEFSDDNRLDPATAEDPNNYVITNDDLAVTAAKILDPEDLDSDDGHVVLLTTAVSDNEEHGYILTINDVADEFGNVIEADTKEKSIDGIDEDIVPPYVVKVEATDSNEVVLTFANDNNQGLLDKASAEDPTNYYIEGLAVKEAELDDDDRTLVTLTTAEMDEQTEYEIVMNNIADINGNTVEDLDVTFFSTGGVDNDRPEIESIEVIARNLVQVTWDEDVDFSAATMTVDGADTDTDAGGPDTDDDAITLTAVGTTVDSDEAIIFQSTAPMINNREYKISAITGVEDEHNNEYVAPTDPDDQDTFDGDDSINEGPEVDSIEQTDAKTVRVVFTEQVQLYDGTATPVTELSGVSLSDDADNDEITLDGLNFDAEVDPEGDADDAGHSTVDLTFGNPIDSDEVIGFNFTAFVTDYAGAPAIDEEDDFDVDPMDDNAVGDQRTSYLKGFEEPKGVTLLDTYYDEDEEPEIADVRAKNNKTIEIVYEEKVDPNSLGQYKVVDEEDDRVSTGTPVEGDEDYIVELPVTGTLSADIVYTLEVTKTAKNMAGNTNSDLSGEEYDFNGSSIAVEDYITGVKQVDAKSVKVYTTKDMPAGTVITVTKASADGDPVGTETIIADDPLTPLVDESTVDDVAVVALDVALVDGVDYYVTISVSDFGEEVKFTADVDGGDLDVDTNIVKFSDWNVEDYVVEVVYDYNGNGIIAADGSERFIVLPSTTNSTTAQFNMATVYTKDGNETAVVIPAQQTFVVEVYRATEDLVPATNNVNAAFGAADTYVGYYATRIEDAPVYVDQFTK
ncbi:MAG TPA: hypothetical protein VEG39_02475 [Clostridia bacterium]|nr:hypothetical protein [Clostridia bacterium]